MKIKSTWHFGRIQLSYYLALDPQCLRTLLPRFYLSPDDQKIIIDISVSGSYLLWWKSEKKGVFTLVGRAGIDVSID